MSEPDNSRLVACLADIERHVSSNGWDQPARLFALVTTSSLLELEPQLRERVPEAMPDALTAIEQENFAAGTDVLARLSGIYWPETVEGAAIAMERAFLPPEYEDQIPEDSDAAVDFVTKHPERTDVRVVVGVSRDGSRFVAVASGVDPDSSSSRPSPFQSGRHLRRSEIRDVAPPRTWDLWHQSGDGGLDGRDD